MNAPRSFVFAAYSRPRAMPDPVNRHWLLTRYPQGEPGADTWTLDVSPVPAPGPGRILVKARFLSVDPYMRGRISPAANYAKGVALGEVMRSGGVGEVVASNHSEWKAGDIAETMGFGWQEWAVLSPGRPGPEGVNRIDPTLAPIESSLSWLGMPGLTASRCWTPALRQHRLRAASGAVGQIVGQIAKIAGCRAIAVAGSDEKLAWCREIGFDAGVNHRTEKVLAAAVKAACPDGVDVFFDNTAGPIYDW